jgi:mono/diheme cytochrome c family protein
MSLPNGSLLTFITLYLLVLSSLTNAGETGNPGNTQLPGLGQEIDSYNGSIISPDGSGLPAGNGAVAEGKVLYERQCASCHGIDGQLPGNQLAGGVGSLSTPRPLKTVGSFWPYATTLYDYIARAMPYNQEKTLSVNEVYAITAYVLNLNEILNDDAVLNDKSLPAIVMPNRDGFIELIQ